MKHIGWLVSALSLIDFSSLAMAGSMGSVSSASINQTGLFLGVGGSYNIVRSNANTSGTLNAVSGLPPLGVFSGNTGSYSLSEQAFSPEAQLGYFQHFNSSNWLWGAEFLYQYSRIKATANGNSRDPGSHVNLLNTLANTTDEITFNAVQMRVDDEFMLPVFLGYSFTDTFIYLGGGPSVFKAQHKVYPGSDEFSGLYAGTINGFSDSKWVWGGAVQTGVGHYLNPSWFLKLNYSYSVTGQYTTKNTVAFATAVNGGLNNGSVSLHTSQRYTAHEIALSINKVFSL